METPKIIGSRRFAPAMDTRAAACIAVALVLATGFALWPDSATYAVWNGSVADGRGFIRWLLSAWTEAEFYTSAFAGAGLLIGALVAVYAEASQKRWRGFGLACGSGLWPWTIASSALGLLLSTLAWGWVLRDTGLWQPTFVPVVSVAPTLVLVYGAGWRTVLTGGALSALVVAPLAIAGTQLVCRPFGISLVVGVTGGMAVGGCLCFALCRILPWMPSLPVLSPAPEPETPDYRLVWTVRRMLADFSEAQFFGNEWASAGLILGVLLTFLVAPGLPVYGSGLLPEVFAAQVLTSAFGLMLWRGKWRRRGFYPTFVPIVSVAPTAVLVFGGTSASVVGGAVLGALMGPPLAATISARLPVGFHPFIGNVASMAISTAVIIPALGLLHAGG